MTPTPIALLQRASDLGLKMKPEGDHLRITPGRLCPPEFAEKLGEHKAAVLMLLRMRSKTWIEVYSHRIEETIFFCAEEETKAALIQAGASEWSIYTRAELQVLVAQNRVAPLTDDELRKLHEIKWTFSGRIAK